MEQIILVENNPSSTNTHGWLTAKQPFPDQKKTKGLRCNFCGAAS